MPDSPKSRAIPAHADTQPDQDSATNPLPEEHGSSADQEEDISLNDDPEEALKDNTSPKVPSPQSKSSGLPYTAKSTPVLTRSSSASNSLYGVARPAAEVTTSPRPDESKAVDELEKRASGGTASTVESLESVEGVEAMEPVSLNEQADEREKTTAAVVSGRQDVPASPRATSKLNITSALGFASSLLPSTSPSRTPDSYYSPSADRQVSSSSNQNQKADAKGSESPSEIAKQASSASWKSSIASYFGSKSPGGSSPRPAVSPSHSRSSRPPLERVVSGSTAFILNNLEATSEDRRRSVEAGGSEALKEEFQRKRDSARIREAAVFEDVAGMEEEVEPSARQQSVVKPKEPTDHGEDGQEPALGPDGIDWPFWGSVMNDYEGVARQRPKDLSRAIQQGIPSVIRGTIWQLMSSSKSLTLESTYARLLKEKSAHEKAIQKDLARTLPGHRYFAQAAGIGQENLFNVVKAYSLYDTEVGYTQGLAFIVAALLLNMPDEEAFCVLVRLMESYDLRTHYTPEMPGLQMRMYQFDRLLEELLPVLHVHFVRKGVKSSMYASTWFLTLFTHRFPLDLVYRIFDIVFAEGIEAIFRFALALMRRNESRLLQLDFESILKFLSNEVFDCYKTDMVPQTDVGSMPSEDAEWLANDFVKDAYATQITPFMLDTYASEWAEQCRAMNAQAAEMDNLRVANRTLSAQVKQLENAMAAMSTEHVEMVRQLVEARIEKETVETELIKYKTLYAELMHEQDSNRASYIAPSNKLSRTVSATSVANQSIRSITQSTTATFHLTMMREALSYSYLCEVSPTAFSVGSIIFLPRASSIRTFDALAKSFAPVDREGLILSHGYSRQLPGNTHAEANAINNLVNQLTNLKADTLANVAQAEELPDSATTEDIVRSVLGKSWIYATMEPCSKRTSGLRDCTAEIISWGIKRVYMGVREPTDYVQCEGVRLLRDAGVEVVSVQGMEEECLAAARRGL